METRVRLVPGDVLELQDGNRFGYLQYLGAHEQYGDAILISPRLLPGRVAITSELFSRGYIAFYPARVAVRQDLVRRVGHIEDHPVVPDRLRRPGAIAERRVTNWLIEAPEGQRLVAELSPEELLLPIGGIWNHEYLVERMKGGWQPSLHPNSV